MNVFLINQNYTTSQRSMDMTIIKLILTSFLIISLNTLTADDSNKRSILEDASNKAFTIYHMGTFIVQGGTAIYLLKMKNSRAYHAHRYFQKSVKDVDILANRFGNKFAWEIWNMKYKMHTNKVGHYIIPKAYLRHFRIKKTMISTGKVLGALLLIDIGGKIYQIAKTDEKISLIPLSWTYKQIINLIGDKKVSLNTEHLLEEDGNEDLEDDYDIE